MILARVNVLLSGPLAVALAAMGTQAHADVMELDADGARWVAGGTVVPGTPVIDPSVTNIDPALLSAPITANGPRRIDAAPPQVDLGSVVLPDMVVSDLRAHAAGVPPRYAAKIAELSRRFDLSESLLEALVWQESRWRENAVSPAGARGLAQLMPGTARYLGVNPDDPMQNLEGGARYLREQLDRFDQDLEKALAAYNAGPGRVIRAGGVPNITETREYVAAIMGRLSNHSRMAGQ
ncbi:MAG: lytic transglycosylase domain-containing protein [Pseudomonadota bacterium]